MVAAFGVVVSVIYLGIQIHQQNEITKAQFGHSLTQRMYERYFNTAKDREFSEFLAKDWAHGELDDADKGRVAIFDYLKVDNKLKSRISNDEFISENSIMGKTILENEAQKLVNKNIVPKFEAKRMSLDIK